MTLMTTRAIALDSRGLPVRLAVLVSGESAGWSTGRYSWRSVTVRSSMQLTNPQEGQRWQTPPYRYVSSTLKLRHVVRFHIGSQMKRLEIRRDRGCKVARSALLYSTLLYSTLLTIAPLHDSS